MQRRTGPSGALPLALSITIFLGHIRIVYENHGIGAAFDRTAANCASEALGIADCSGSHLGSSEFPEHTSGVWHELVEEDEAGPPVVRQYDPDTIGLFFSRSFSHGAKAF